MDSPLKFVDARFAENGHVKLSFVTEGNEPTFLIVRADNLYSMAHEIAGLADYILCDGYCNEDRD